MDDKDLRVEVFYDGDCGVCTRIKGRIEQSSAGRDFAFKNIQMGELPPGVDREAAIRDVHAVDGGMLYRGGDVLFVLARRYPRYRWLARLEHMRVARTLARAAYRLLATNRGFFSRFI